MEITDTYVADLVVGRLAWAHVAGEDRLHLARLVERAAPYLNAAGYEPVNHAGHVLAALGELVPAGLVEEGDPTYGETTYGIVTPDDESQAEDSGWRERARRAAEYQVIRCDPETQLEGGAKNIVLGQDVALLWDAVRVLDLLDRAPNR